MSSSPVEKQPTPYHETPEARAMRGETISWEQLADEWESDGLGNFIQPEKKKFNGEGRKASVEDVKDALEFISADIPNQDWVLVGMAIKDEFGEDGFDVWNDWSARGSKYNKYEMKTRWRSFGRRDGVTIGSLFHMAQQEGWNPTPRLPEPTPEFILNGKMTGHSYPAEKKTDPHKKSIIEPPIAITNLKKTDFLEFPAELLKAPGLPGMLANFINRTSLIPQPILALGAALATAGALMGRKVRSDTNIRTNMYVMALAPSGSGKDHARTIIKRLLYDTGLGKLELGVPASSAGLLSSLHHSGEGRGLVIWDEFGRTLKQYMGFKASTHERDIITAMVELFSSAQSVYMGKAYANHDGKKPTKPIDQPCLSVYGTSVPSHFYDSLSGSDAIDGFLSRWLLFESKDYSLEEEDRDQVFAEIPQHMIDICKYWKEQPFNTEPDNGNLSDTMRVVPKLIKCSDAASAWLKGFSMEMRKKARHFEMSGNPAGAIWSRAGEHARRLALVGCEGDQIELKVAEWASKLSAHCCQYMGDAISDYVSSSELEANTKRVLRSLREKNDWVSRAELTRSFQGIQTRVRNEILTSLLERGEIIQEIVSSQGRPKIRYKVI